MAIEAFERARVVARATNNPSRHNATAGLARVALAEGDETTAMREVATLLSEAASTHRSVARSSGL